MRRAVLLTVAASLCCNLPVDLYCEGNIRLTADDSDQQSASNVIPLPEAEKEYDSPTPVDAIVVDKDGDMSEQQYTYDPDAGGVVINNYNEVSGPDCSIYFPLFAVGFIWWGGYWCDHDGYYWSGHGYHRANYNHWHNHWNNYWHNNWNNKWHQYSQRHPNSQYARGANRQSFSHHQGMSRQGHQPQYRQRGFGGRSGGGGHGGGRGGGGGHGGGGHGGGHGGGGGHGR